MNLYVLILRATAPIFFIVAALHLTLGVGAEVLLGAKLGADALADPVLDSQNRFYGVSFAVFGVLLWLCSSDLTRYRPVLRCLLWVFFAAGMARFVAIVVHGMPAMPVLVLMTLEIALPPALLVWLARLPHSADG